MPHHAIDLQLPSSRSPLHPPKPSYPGWRVWVDGEASEMMVIGGLLRGVALEPGAHQVVFAFRPLSLFLGLVLFVTGCFFLLQTSFLSRLFAVVTRRLHREEAKKTNS